VRRALQRVLVLTVALAALGAAAAQQVGRPLPDFELRDQHGVLVTNVDMLGGPWLLNVWASWCPPCRAELPLLERAAAELADDGLRLLLLNAGETAAVATRFLDAEGLALRTLVDPDDSERGLERSNDTLRRLRTGGLPTTYFVDADGTLLATFVGELTPDALAERLASVYGFDWTP
jgi:cytochrome c biogenesis protein CcmG, thiol:disulfide interchange protein DsbE